MIPDFGRLVITSITCFMYSKFLWPNQVFAYFTEKGKGSTGHIWLLIPEISLGILTYVFLMGNAEKH